MSSLLFQLHQAVAPCSTPPTPPPPSHTRPPAPFAPVVRVPILYTPNKQSLPRSSLQGSEKISARNSLTQTNVIILSLSSPAHTHSNNVACTHVHAKRFRLPATNQRTTKKQLVAQAFTVPAVCGLARQHTPKKDKTNPVSLISFCVPTAEFK